MQKNLDFGEKTGIELYGETKGVLASKEYAESIGLGNTDYELIEVWDEKRIW